MKRPSTSDFVTQLNLHRLLLPCTVALVLLAFARPGLAQDLPEGKTAKGSIVATTGSGLEASLGTPELSSPRSSGSCPSVKCWIACDNGLSHSQVFANAFACYSYSDGYGCHSSGFFVCSDSPVVAGC